MSFKTWIFRKMNGITTRADLPRSPVFHTPVPEGPSVTRRSIERSEPAIRHGEAAPSVANLGAYAPLIAAIRDELEHFVVSYLRLHLTIAERDRYLLTSIDVRAAGDDDSAELIQRFIREFRPEQIKEYFAKEVIGPLPNAGAIDLSQFSGLNAERGDEDKDDDDDGYSELLAELKSANPSPAARRFEVNLIGRWSEAGPSGPAARGRTPTTPLAGRDVQIAIEDADGSRHVLLRSVVPGRRYAIGKGEGCDVAVNGVYASRRHCEIWFENGVWWVTDTGSTNGIRVERGASVLGRSTSATKRDSEAAVVELTDGARLVLSAYADGEPKLYPRLVLSTGRDRNTATPIAPVARAQATPSTPIVAARPRESGWAIAVRMASGSRTVELGARDLPFSVGRSRGQGLAIDWAHEGVSGHHLDVVAIDEAGATVVVHGDNGVRLAGTSYAPGARIRWKSGDSIALGRVIGREPECELTLLPRMSA
jgi:hypothetical protein